MDSIKATVDTSEWAEALQALKGDFRTRLARSMAVAGGEVLRDEAKARVTEHTGRLKNAIYLAYRDAHSTEKVVMYSVSWNAKKAPHGHLVEFGHWQVHPARKDQSGEWVSDPTKLLKEPRWVPADPFLRPAFDATRERIFIAMANRGRERLPELLAEAKAGG